MAQGKEAALCIELPCLTSSRAQEAFLAEQISRFCAEHCLFRKMDCYHDQESFFEAARNEPLTNAVIALPGSTD